MNKQDLDARIVAWRSMIVRKMLKARFCGAYGLMVSE